MQALQPEASTARRLDPVRARVTRLLGYRMVQKKPPSAPRGPTSVVSDAAQQSPGTQQPDQGGDWLGEVTSKPAEGAASAPQGVPIDTKDRSPQRGRAVESKRGQR